MNSPSEDSDDDELTPYEKRKERERIRQREQARLGQEVGPIPEVKDPALRATVWKCLKTFCEVVFPETFYLPWSKDHLEVLEATQRIIEAGGQLALAMPRGSGKSAIFLAAVLWAILTGRKKCAVLVAANNAKCKEMLEGIKDDTLLDSDILLSLFPEAVWPIRCLDGQTNRAGRQTVDGEKTRIGWSGKDVRLPRVAGSKCSGGMILVRSLTSEGMRGLLKRIKGKSIRPDLLLVDDPQTDRSAKSEKMTRERMRLLSAALKGLKGPRVTMSILAAVTVIQTGDLAAQILDREKRPEWRGRKYVMLKSFPTDLSIWMEYARRRDDELRTSEVATEAIKWLRKRYKKASAGGEASWPENYEAHQIDGLHAAMDMYTSSDPDTVAAFHSEYQNEPLDDQVVQGLKLNALEIPQRTIELQRGLVPDWASKITCFIDVQHKLLYWMVVAWGEKLRGHILDYGAWPDQKQPQFTRRQPPVPLSSVYRGLPMAAAVKRGLRDLFEKLATRTFLRLDGNPMPIDRIGVDTGDGVLCDAILEACQTTPHKGLVWASRGWGSTPDGAPMREWKVDITKGESRGDRWVRTKMKQKRALQFVIDVNFWKSTVAGKLACPIEVDGAITLYGKRGTYHGQLAQHLTSETFDSKYSAKSDRTIDIWRLVNEHNENEGWDCLVGYAALAESCGLKLDPPPPKPPDEQGEQKRRERVSYLSL